jgi:hypothetical protein
MSKLLLTLMSSLVLLCGLFAQKPGSGNERIYKISTPDKSFTKGYLSAFSDSAVIISFAPVRFSSNTHYTTDHRSINYNDLGEIYVRRKGSTGRGILYGVIAGAATGAIIGLASGDDPPCETNPSDFFGLGYGLCNAFRTTAGEKALGGGVVLGLGGGIIGAL